MFLIFVRQSVHSCILDFICLKSEIDNISDSTKLFTVIEKGKTEIKIRVLLRGI